jgi:hypothetical protein
MRVKRAQGVSCGLSAWQVSVVDPATGIKFHYAYKLVAGPLFFRRSTWVDLGMFNLNFSCAGDPGIHFEYEYRYHALPPHCPNLTRIRPLLPLHTSPAATV